MENPLVVIASPGHALAGKKRIPVQQLAGETFLVREAGSGTRSAMERIFQEHGIAFNAGMVMSTNEAIKQAVQAGMGLGIVSLHTVALELETGRLAILDVESFPILRHWFVVHRQNKRLSPVAAGFKAFLLQEAAQLMAKESGFAAVFHAQFLNLAGQGVAAQTQQLRGFYFSPCRMFERLRNQDALELMREILP